MGDDDQEERALQAFGQAAGRFAESLKRMSAATAVVGLELRELIDARRPDLRSAEIGECLVARVQRQAAE